MALRTFRSNPALGGFGGESSAPLVNRTGNAAIRVVDCDAFAQIIKELVDNAVDACSVNTNGNTNDNNTTTSTVVSAGVVKKKRVRVSIERVNPSEADSDSDDQEETKTGSGRHQAARNQASSTSGKQEILRVTVLDNGCGMNDIQASVDAFHTSKAHAARANQDNNSDDNDDDDNNQGASTARGEGRTAGRYGIGLTLCLLHAQRLVPNSCATIKSATAGAAHYDFVTCVVDTEGDSVRCIRRQQLPKSFADESGTAVSVLVPGGDTAMLAWPRLAEYFARFKLSLGLQCSLEVMAPSLSNIPLVVRPFDQYVRGTQKAAAKSNMKKVAEPKEIPWTEGFEYDEEEKVETGSQSSRQESPHSSDDNDDDDDNPYNDDERTRIWKAAQLYLGHPLRLINVVHALVPIRVEGYHATDASCPKLEVDLIVHGEDGEGESADLEADDDGDDDDDTEMNSGGGSGSAGMLLVRMVNRIPLLDGAEAVACGLVQGLAAKKRVWNSFGLDVGLHYDSNNITKLPTFQVRDSDQVAPFFKTGAHALYEEDEEELDEQSEGDDSVTEDDRERGDVPKRKRNRMRRVLLPAKVRLGKIIVIVQIHAEPTTLPLPTLSKGRLPVDNPAIDTALEVGLTECLRKLQKSNPGLLLTAAELRKAERDARYVPALSSALATILCKSQIADLALLRGIRSWGEVKEREVELETELGEATELGEEETIDTPSHREQIEELGALIEGRLRLVLSHGGKRKTNEEDESGSVAESRQDGSQEQRWEVEMDDILEQSSTEGENSNPESSQDSTIDGLTEL